MSHPLIMLFHLSICFEGQMTIEWSTLSSLATSHVVVWRRQWHPTPVLVPGKSHGQRSLVGSSPWGRKESDTTEQLHFHFSLSCIGEGNGNPLQCSCLENPRDGEAWWAAVYGVTQSQTRLKQLSRSSSAPNKEQAQWVSQQGSLLLVLAPPFCSRGPNKAFRFLVCHLSIFID